MQIAQKGYVPVEVDQEPLPCPFCGGSATLSQLHHVVSNGKRYSIVASTRTQKADTFWFKCSECRATTGNHQKTAQAAVDLWNRREG